MCIEASGVDNIIKILPNCKALLNIVTFDNIPEDKK